MRSLFFLSSAFAPLSGWLAGWQGAMVTFGLRACITAVFSHLSSCIMLVYHLPTLFASFFFILGSNQNKASYQRWFIWGTLGVCSLLFIYHPLGSQAWIYTLVWLVPLFALKNQTNLFCQALISTFIAHATGSVIWLYAGLGPATADGWIALIPLVIIERILLAGIMSFGMLSIMKIQTYVGQTKTSLPALSTTVQDL